MGLFDSLEGLLLKLLQPIIGPVRALVNLVTKFKETITGFLENGDQLVTNVERVIELVKTFQEKPHWKSRVISGPRAIKNVQDLFKIPQDIWAKVRDLITIVKARLGDAQASADELTSEVEGVEDLRGLALRLGPKIAKVFERVLGYLAFILDIFDTANTTMTDINAILTDLITLLEDFNNLDGLFLPQKNKRKKIETDIGIVRIRVGVLHGLR